VEFKGHVLREKATAAFCVTETIFDGDVTLPRHEHSKAYVSFLLAGAYVERTRASERDCSMGTVIWHPAGETHSDRFCEQGGHLLNLEFQKDWLRRIQSDVQLTQPYSSCGGLPYLMGLSLYHFLNTGHRTPEDLAIELLSLYTPSFDHPMQPDWFGRVLQLIHDAYGENLTLAVAARAGGVHPVHVSRSFRRVLGCTFTEYLGQVRLRRVFDFLRSSTLALVDVAVLCGFADHAHMSRSFKRNTGITPSAYRSYL